MGIIGSERNISKSKGESLVVVWACEKKGRKLYRKKSDGDGDSRKEKEVDGQHHRGHGRILVEGEGHWGSGEVEKKNPLWRPYLSRRSRKKKKK